MHVYAIHNAVFLGKVGTSERKGSAQCSSAHVSFNLKLIGELWNCTTQALFLL